MTAPADLERRLHAFVVDRALLAAVAAAAGLVGWPAGAASGWTVGGAVLIAALLVECALAASLGRTGRTPGRAVAGVRVVDEDSGTAIGVPAALLRQLTLAIATLPTLGLGAAALAWSAAVDPSGRRRGWHDQLVGSAVVDARATPPAQPVSEPEHHRIVNLTALRLAPAPAEPGLPVVRRTSADRPAPPHRWRIGFDSGESLVVEDLVLVGRRPEAQAGERPGRLVPLPSADLSLSKTHAQLQVAGDGALVVMDRGSTTGSVLIRQGVSRDLSPGRATTLVDGDRLRLGDREMRVTREP